MLLDELKNSFKGIVNVMKSEEENLMASFINVCAITI
jgi:hypothetical protein